RGTLHLLEACRQHGVGHFLFASSSSVYGEQQEHPFQEDLDADHPVSPYGATKRAAELLGYTYHRLYGLPFTSLRFFTVYGPRQRPEMAIHKFTRLIDRGEPVPLYGDGSSKRDYTYIDDLLDGILKASGHPDGYRIYNLGESRMIGLLDLVRLLEAALGKRADIRYLPAQPGDVPVTYADLGRAKAELGYAPKIAIEEGIARFVAWYRKNAQEVLHPSPPSPHRGEGLG
ncbi:MAG: GDP-mannose 4,6-dehydratase, partial [Nitrospirae bacterium]|nr:GDP-mannose 4,6-dehydratase [Nitrospirota bacterium]